MASARVYETTRDRLIAMFNRKDFTPDKAYYQFRGMYPLMVNHIDYEVIGGCIKYIREYIGIDGCLTDMSSGCIFSFNINEQEAWFDTDTIMIKCINYNSQYPIIRVLNHQNRSIIYNNIGTEGIAYMIQNTIVMRLMCYLSTILANSYKENYYKRW